MITEDYVSYEVAKLLKDRGFDEPCFTFWENELCEYSLYIAGYHPISNSELEKVLVNRWSAPTHQMAMKWLREKYNIYISIQPDFPSDKDYKMCWCWSVSTLHENCINIKGYQCYIETYEEACEAALKYYLEKLI